MPEQDPVPSPRNGLSTLTFMIDWVDTLNAIKGRIQIVEGANDAPNGSIVYKDNNGRWNYLQVGPSQVAVLIGGNMTALTVNDGEYLKSVNGQLTSGL